jgi:predicted TIM-barrel enzyme
MKKGLMFLLPALLISSAYADIPYCVETQPPSPSKNAALQYVVKEFANMFGCEVGSNCLQNFQMSKYSVAWAGRCAAGKGSTFICDNGSCYPYGFSYPRASY